MDNVIHKIFVFVTLSAIVSLTACAGLSQNSSTEKEYMALFTKQGSFKDVREAVELAITDRGMVINNVSHIGKMLARTGKDIENSKTIYQHAEAIEFCSATVSRAMMEADPHNIVFCPYIIAIYEAANQPGTIHLNYRHPNIVGDDKSKQSLQAVEDLLSGIIKDTLEW